METKLINGANITINSNNNKVMIAERIGFEFIFLAQFNKVDHLEQDVLDSVMNKMKSLILHQHEARKKHERKISLDGHFSAITNTYLKYLDQEMGFKNEEHNTLLNNAIFCIVQTKTNYGQGIIFKNGYILNNDEVFEVLDKQDPSYLNFLKNTQDRHWCKPGDNLFFLRDIETTTLSEKKISQEDLSKYLQEGSSKVEKSFLSLNIED